MLNRDTLEELGKEEVIKEEEIVSPQTSPVKKQKATRIPRLKDEPVMQRSKRQHKDNPKYGKQFGFIQGY